MSDAIDAFLDAPSKVDAFLDAPTTRTETKAHSFKQYDPSSSMIGKLFGKYAPDVLDIASGMTSTLRGAVNMVSPGAITENQTSSSLGLPYNADKESAGYMAGQIIDPAALATGAGVGKVVQAVPTITKGFKAAQLSAKSPLTIEAIGRGAATGAATGAGVGYLASEGDTQDASTAGLFGGALGAAVPLGGWAVQRGTGKLIDMATGRTGQVSAGQVARKAAGDKLGDIRTALSSAPSDITAGQAAVDVGSPKWSALSKFGESRGGQSDFYYDLMKRQEAARQGLLTGVTPDLESALATRSTNFNAANDVAKKAAQLSRTARETTVMPPQPNVEIVPSKLQPGATTKIVTPGNTPENLPGITSLESLKQNPVINSVMADARRMASSRSGLPSDLAGLTDDQIKDIIKDPMKSLEGIQMMKAAIDARFAKNPSAESALSKYDDATITKVKSALMGGVKKAFPEYEAARAGFAADSAPVNQANILNTLSDILKNSVGGKERATPFMNALGRGEESALKKAGINTRFSDTADVLTGKQMGAVNEVGRQLTRDQELSRQAIAGASDLETTVGSGVRLPNLMDQKAALANKVLEYADKFLHGKTHAAIAEGMKSGKSAIEMLDTLPTAEKNRMLLWVNKQSQNAAMMGVPASSIGATRGQ